MPELISDAQRYDTLIRRLREAARLPGADEDELVDFVTAMTTAVTQHLKTLHHLTETENNNDAS